MSAVSPRKLMFVYRPPKGSCWGHSFGKDQTTGIPKLEALIDTFFERVEQQGPTTVVLAWKDSVLPKVEWPDVFLGTDKQKLRQFLFMVMGNRVSFPMGIVFPLSTTEPASFEFLRRFRADAPFKMSAKHLMVGITAGNGKFAWRKPDTDILAAGRIYRLGVQTRANPRMEATADSAMDLPLEFLICVSHSSAVPHSTR